PAPKNPPCIPPAPSCTAENESGEKEISLGFANPFPQNCFAKPSPHLYSRFRPFPFGKALCFAQRRASATDARH
ncbi:MAG: hypothetical protein KBC49_03975, partial [Candidatus Pacebacteria bacterium]|nr:hypothetical protein [Candidatus Paceibacterota bacterium]